MRNYRGELTECTTANLFVVRTAPCSRRRSRRACSRHTPRVPLRPRPETGIDVREECCATRTCTAQTRRSSRARPAKSCRSCEVGWTIGRSGGDRGRRRRPGPVTDPPPTLATPASMAFRRPLAGTLPRRGLLRRAFPLLPAGSPPGASAGRLRSPRLHRRTLRLCRPCCSRGAVRHVGRERALCLCTGLPVAPGTGRFRRARAAPRPRSARRGAELRQPRLETAQHLIEQIALFAAAGVGSASASARRLLRTTALLLVDVAPLVAQRAGAGDLPAQFGGARVRERFTPARRDESRLGRIQPGTGTGRGIGHRSRISLDECGAASMPWRGAMRLWTAAASRRDHRLRHAAHDRTCSSTTSGIGSPGSAEPPTRVSRSHR
jgi:hypothetical protein